MRRKLLFGVTLFLALGSVYAGLLEWGPWVQYSALVASVVCAFAAMLTKEDEHPG